MNTTIWIIQGLLSAAFIFSGLSTLLLSKEKLVIKFPWANDFSLRSARLIGLAKLLGGIGILFPSLLIFRWSRGIL